MSRRLRHLLAALLLGTAALTAGCAALFLQNIYDIRLESFEIVSLDDHPELHPERSSTPRPTYLARIHFSTTRDLVAFAPKNQAIGVSFRASECDSNEIDKKRVLGGPYVYNRFGEVDFRNENPVAESPISGGRYLYYSFVHLIGYGNGTINDYTRPAYDLGQQPTDLCFVIRGGSMLGVSSTSNLTHIPAATLRAALARANLPALARTAAPSSVPGR